MERLLFVAYGALDDALLIEELRAEFLVQVAHVGSDSLTRAMLWQPALLLMNIDGAVTEAAALIRELRSKGPMDNTGIVVLTEKTDIVTEEALYSSGADIVVHRPVGMQSLHLRLTALAQRVNGRTGVSHFPLGNLSLDPKNSLVRRHDRQTITVSERSMQLLMFFARHQEHVVTREQIQDAVWNDKKISLRSIDAYISKLKKQVPELNELVLKAYGKGYRIHGRRRAA